MPHVKYSLPVEAELQTIWNVLLDKVEHPERYMQYVESVRFLEDKEDYAIREIKTEDMSLQEKITINESLGEVVFELLDHPLFDGTVTHNVSPLEPPVLTITMNWQPKNEEGIAVEKAAMNDITMGIEEAVKFLKATAERQGNID